MSRKCDKINCKNDGKFQVVLQLYATGFDAHVDAALGIIVCEERHKIHDVNQYLGDAGWNRIVEALTDVGKPAPSRELTTIRFDPFPSPSEFRIDIAEAL